MLIVLFFPCPPPRNFCGLPCVLHLNEDVLEAHTHISYFEDTWIGRPIDIEGRTLDILFHHGTVLMFYTSTISGLPRKIIALIIY